MSLWLSAIAPPQDVEEKLKVLEEPWSRGLPAAKQTSFVDWRNEVSSVRISLSYRRIYDQCDPVIYYSIYIYTNIMYLLHIIIHWLAQLRNPVSNHRNWPCNSGQGLQMSERISSATLRQPNGSDWWLLQCINSDFLRWNQYRASYQTSGTRGDNPMPLDIIWQKPRGDISILLHYIFNKLGDSPNIIFCLTKK